MAASVIYNQTEVLDQEALGEYQKAFRAMFEKYGGKVLASPPRFDVLEGDWDGVRVVVIEFPDMDALKRWYESDEYKPLIKMRMATARGDMITLEGME